MTGCPRCNGKRIFLLPTPRMTGAIPVCGKEVEMETCTRSGISDIAHICTYLHCGVLSLGCKIVNCSVTLFFRVPQFSVVCSYPVLGCTFVSFFLVCLSGTAIWDVMPGYLLEKGFKVAVIVLAENRGLQAQSLTWIPNTRYSRQWGLGI